MKEQLPYVYSKRLEDEQDVHRFVLPIFWSYGRKYQIGADDMLTGWWERRILIRYVKFQGVHITTGWLCKRADKAEYGDLQSARWWMNG